MISVAGKQVAQGRIEHTMPVRLSLDETFDLGDTKLTAADVERVRGLGQAARRSIH